MYNRRKGGRYVCMEMTGFVLRHRRLLLKVTPLLVLAFIWLWFLIAVYVIGSYSDALNSLFGWELLA